MKSKKITLAALVIAAAALLFAIVTLIRSIVIGNGVFLGIILVVGSTLITALCAVMFITINRYDESENEGDDEGDDEPGEEEEPERKERKAPRERRVNRPAKERRKTALAPSYGEEEPETSYALQESPVPDDEPQTSPEPAEEPETDIEAEIDRILAELEQNRS